MQHHVQHETFPFCPGKTILTYIVSVVGNKVLNTTEITKKRDCFVNEQNDATRIVVALFLCYLACFLLYLDIIFGLQ